MLLTRKDFRESVFERDDHKCVICGQPAKDAHHILERRLFADGGYYLNNGASLCSKHHIQAEETTLSVEEIRKACKIKTAVLPDHLYEDANYDKWGNIILDNGLRIKGELFNDTSVQKILKQGNILSDFTNRVKHPRTYHVPWSEGMNRDDRMMDDVAIYEGEEVVITEKMDGENTSWYSDYTHARSIETATHPSRSWMKNFWAQKGYNIPIDWRVCGENLYAKHAIHYCKENNNQLHSFFQMFSIWNEQNVCLSWTETKQWAELLEIPLVPILYEGIWDMNFVNQLNSKVKKSNNGIEGYVVRLQREFNYAEFRKVVGKYVRADHVQKNHGHWTRNKVIANETL